MTLTSELLPATQHYALLAVAVTLFSLTTTQFKVRLNVWVWLAMVVLPVAQMAWSLWETVWEAVLGQSTLGQPVHEPGSYAAWAIVVQALAHGVAIALVLAVVLHVVGQTRDAMPRRVRLEPTV